MIERKNYMFKNYTIGFQTEMSTKSTVLLVELYIFKTTQTSLTNNFMLMRQNIEIKTVFTSIFLFIYYLYFASGFVCVLVEF
jgi:hypothetical protein